jgi:hypothetical protein
LLFVREREMEGDEDDLRTQVFRLTDALKRVEDVADAQVR